MESGMSKSDHAQPQGSLYIELTDYRHQSLKPSTSYAEEEHSPLPVAEDELAGEDE